MIKNKPVHCVKCSKVILVINKEEEVEFTCMCPHCKEMQTVSYKRSFNLKVDKLKK